MMMLTASLIATLPQNGPTDPIEFYKRPLVGWLFRERINRGLALLGERRFARALEIGYGAGAVQLALGRAVDELHGIDLDADPARIAPALAARGVRAELVQGSVLEMPYPDGHFDLAVCFSVFEHLADYRRALAEVARVLRPGGHFLLGMPSVNKGMEAAFRMMGFKGIADHHITTPRMVSDCFGEAGFTVAATSHLDLPARRPAGLRLYYDWLLIRR